MKKMKKAVYDTAKLLFHPNNTLTTLEIKTRLIADYPQYYWKQIFVSDTMDEYAKNGTFTYTDNGTYRTYSDPTYKFPSNMVTRTSTTKSAKKATKKVAPAPKKVAKKAAPIKATKKAAPKKAAVVSKKATPSTHNVRRIGKSKAATLILNAKGRFGTATFIKKDGTQRTLNFQVLADQTDNVLGYIKVKDMQLYRSQPTDCTRQINLQTLSGLSLNGEKYKVS